MAASGKTAGFVRVGTFDVLLVTILAIYFPARVRACAILAILRGLLYRL